MKSKNQIIVLSLILFMAGIMGATRLIGGTLTNMSWTSTSNVPGATGVTYTFNYTIETGSPQFIIRALSYLYTPRPFNCSFLTEATDLTVKVNGVEKTIDLSNTGAYENGIGIKLLTLSDAPAGANITVIVRNVVNGSSAGSFSWNLFCTANPQGGSVDTPTSINNIVLQFPPPPNPTSVSISPSPACFGSETTLTATGDQGTVYWYSESCGGVEEGQGSPMIVYPTQTTTYYARNFQNGVFSTGCASASVTVYPELTASVSGGTTPICYNTSPGTFTATGGGGTGSSYTYEWYQDDELTGVTTRTFNPGPLTSSSWFYCAVTNGTCGTAYTDEVDITVYDILAADISGGTSPICYNTSPGT